MMRRVFLTKSTYWMYRAQWRRWMLRFYALAFVTLGIFAVADAFRHDEILNIAFRAIAGVVGAVAVAMGVVGMVYGIRARRVRRRNERSWM